MVEHSEFKPMTSTMQVQHAANCANTPDVLCDFSWNGWHYTIPRRIMQAFLLFMVAGVLKYQTQIVLRYRITQCP